MKKRDSLTLMFALAGFLMLGPVQSEAEVFIRGVAGPSEIVIRASRRFGGAIDSLTWNGREFIDRADHGRQLQSASNLDALSPITAETFNPTEAGSRRDGDGPTSSSRILRMVAEGNRLQTHAQMAFWLVPGESSGPNLAKNRTVLSNHQLSKAVTIGYAGNPRRIRYDVTFYLPLDERHTHAVFESLTGYMPPEFSRFWTLNPTTGQLITLSDGPGEQEFPVVFSTLDGGHAMGVISTDVRTKGYGRWRFVAEKVVKWNCVFRVDNPVPGKAYSFSHDLSVGTLDQVREDLAALAKPR